MSIRHPTIGPAIYRARDGVSDLACIITMVDTRNSSADPWLVTLTVFPPMKPPEFYNRIKFSPDASPTSATPGTAYRW